MTSPLPLLPLKIAFHVNHFSIRGSEIAVFDYARCNDLILNNTSIIAVPSDFRDKRDYRGRPVHDEEIYKRFSFFFKIFEYESKDHLSSILKDEGVSIFYNLKSGENDNFLFPGVKNVCHSIFTYNSSQKHGDIYIPISPTIVDKNIRDLTPFVPHMVKPLPPVTDNLRSFLNIPDTALVFGRYGGEETFNIPFVHQAIVEIAESNPNIYFIFTNTELFTNPRNNIIFMQKISDPKDKRIFINTCDAMIHARKEGESFGLAIAEFSISGKPIVTWKHNRSFDQIEKEFGMKIDVEHTHHIDTLGDSGLYYDTKESLKNLILTFSRGMRYIDNYTDLYSPIRVMEMFDKYIIKPSYSRIIETTSFDGYLYNHFSGDDLAKSLTDNGWEPHVYNTIKKLVKPTDTFVDVGSNIGYHSIRISPFVSKVISIEPCKAISDLLVHNIKLNNLKNVVCVISGLSSTQKTLYIKPFSSSTTNFGDIRLTDLHVDEYDEPVQCVDLDYLMENQTVTIGVIKVDVSGREVEVIKGAIKTIIKHKPYIIIPLESKMFKNGSCFGLKHLMTVLNYSMVEIHSDYPCDHLCYPNEKKSEIERIFNGSIYENKPNTINNNVAIGIKYRIIVDQDRIKSSGFKEVPKMTRVKLMCNWTTGDDLCRCWEKMSKGNGMWNNIQVVPDDKDIDYYVIINKPRNGDKYIPSKTMVFRMEPDTSTSSRWNDWYSNKRDFMYFFDLEKYRNNSEWHLGLTYNDLKTTHPTKTKVLSSVVSSLYDMEGHRKRIDFIKYCQSKGMMIDVYGRDNTHNLKSHKGELPYHNKNEGILPYKYTFIAENCSMDNYFTEKIIDSILGETLCFYWGCSNIGSFIDPRSYIALDLNDMEKSLSIVVNSISNNEWETRLPFIRKEKEKIISRYSFFPRIEGYISLSNLDCKVVNLDRRSDRWEKFEKDVFDKDFHRYSRFPAVDGINMKIDSTVALLFQNFSHRRPKRGEVGCALSHLKLWETVATNVLQNRDTLILEDDISFVTGFNDRLAMVYQNMKEVDPEFDVLYIGYHINKDVGMFSSENLIISLEDIMRTTSTLQHMFGSHGGGTFGYIVSPRGAKKLISSLNNGFLFPVDYQMLLSSKLVSLKSYCAVTPLIESEMYEQSNMSVDTDIQNTDTI